MSSTGNSDVSVVILTKNSARTIEGCLRSVVEEKPGEVLAVDNASTDGTVDVLKRYGVTILVDRLGSLGYSRQLGVETSRGTYVMFVDSDVELGWGCIMKLRNDLRRFGWVGAHAQLLSRENVSYWQRAEDEAFRTYYGRVGRIDRIDTIAAMFTREILIRYPFDPTLRSGEDVEICRRLREDDHQLGVSSATAYHYHRREFSAFAKQRFGYGLQRGRSSLERKSIRMLLDPLLVGFSASLRSVLANRIHLVPYWVAGGLAGFLGVVAGVSRTRHLLDPTMAHRK
jgi:glycosyltransferase involved in cell wall biosynthesis